MTAAAGSLSSPQGVALVTGASTGIGLATAKALARAGYRVFGTSRRALDSTPDLTMLVCDVPDDASVRAVVETVIQRADRIDLVVNNAGVGLIGGAEESSIAQVQRLFEVNVFGVARVVNAVLPLMRGQGRGRIVTLSSVLGLIPAPYNAHYAATKHAIEGYAESLDHEVRALGIRSVLVEPGVTRTAFEENLSRADQPLPTYAAERARSEAMMRRWVEAGDSPEVVADIVVKAATDRVPRLRYAAGRQARQVSTIRRFLPERVVDRLLRKVNEFPA